MDVRGAMTFSGSGSYYTHRGFSQHESDNMPAGLFHSPPGFQPISSPNPNSQTSARLTFPGESSQPDFPCSNIMSESVKRKRGRPRKYGPDGPSLDLAPISNTTSAGLMMSPTPKRARGRPRGSGRKQRLANLGQWMTESAGLAFAPHIINVGIGEDVVAKVLSFSQQRQRAVCILSGNGRVSAVTLCQHASSSGNLKFEGHFEILCLSGSYLLSESSGSRVRVGGINVSLSTSSGPVIGGSVSMLIAESPVQVVACSFVYGNPKAKDKTTADLKHTENSLYQPGDEATSSCAPPNQHRPQSSMMPIWSGFRNPHTDIDLTRG